MSADDYEVSSAADRARRLFVYLRELAELRTKIVLDLASYEAVAWFADIPDDAPAVSAFRDDHRDEVGTWLEYDRVEVRPPPVPDSSISPWIDMMSVRDLSLDSPRLTLDEDPEVDTVPAHVMTEFEEYVTQRWSPWRTERARFEPAYQAYSKLFAMRDRHAALGEVYEIVLSLGLLTWRRSGKTIRRHMITTPVEILIDENTGNLSVVPTDSEGRNRFELDMLDSTDRGPATTVQPLVDEVEQSEPLFLAETGLGIIERWLRQSHPDGLVHQRMSPAAASDAPTVSLAPALVLRRRGQRTVAEMLDGIARQIEETNAIVPGVRSLVAVDSGDRSLDEGTTHNDPELYFPLPANDEQRQIVESLNSRDGLLVQGPPGTGKSHTIANLVSHLLATGKRVLVTSHTDRALKVLQEKLPAEIRSLCISLLGSDRDSIRALEDSVAQISSRQQTWSRTRSEGAIDRLRSDLHKVREHSQVATNRIRKMREAQTLPLSLASYSGTTQQIALELANRRSEDGWVSDTVHSDTPPLSDVEYRELVLLTKELTGSAAAAADAPLPNADDLPSLADFTGLAARESELASSYDEVLRESGPWIRELESTQVDRLESAADALERLTIQLSRRRTGWAADALRDIVEGRTQVLAALYRRSCHLLDRIQGNEALIDLTVSVPANHSLAELHAAAVELLGVASDKGKLKVGLFSSSTVKRHRWVLEEVAVDGASPDTTTLLRSLVEWLDVGLGLDDLAAEWKGRATVDPGLTRSMRIAGFRTEIDDLEGLLEVENVLEEARTSLADLESVPSPDWGDERQLQELVRVLRSVISRAELTGIRDTIDTALFAVGPDDHPTIQMLREAIEQRDATAYSTALEKLDQDSEFASQERRRRGLESALSSVAPDLARRVAASEIDDSAELSAAWAWAFADRELSDLDDDASFARLQSELATLESRERDLKRKLAAELAWQRMFEAMRPEHSMALKAWAVAVRRIGRGTGKYATSNRRTARQYMREAQDAIPAWIMPMYRVAESLSSDPEPFDVVIVDEASQSGVESLFLFHLGRQIIVVGDDQQIAPEGVGVDQARVKQLQQQLLDGIPFAALYAPTNSLFDQAKVRFDGHVSLREHFRCMPEIIEFSNRLSYRQQPLVPLRQFGSDRLPPIKRVYLSHGYKEGGRRAINRSEAAEIVERVAKMCADSKYDSKTLGVVTLLGRAQAPLIESMLLERLGPTMMLERQIVCGDAYAFQGDERDVMFLCMVAAPNERFTALANNAAKRRFNVAASRARDQVWLIHSVQVEDLSPSDMRRELLSYYNNPQIEHLEELAERDWSVKQPEFDSLFEQDVYLDLRRAGFRVAPQLRVAGYSLDLVVEGGQKRLAVECDGDAWHGPDRWDSDMARQRQLERCGWEFVRIRGSAYYRDKVDALRPLWTALDIRGIEPLDDVDGAKWETADVPFTGPGEADSAAIAAASLVDDDLVEAENDDAEVEGDETNVTPTIETGSGALIPTPSIGEVVESDEWPDDVPRLQLGDRVHHPRLGEGRVAGVAKTPPKDDDSEFVRIRFGHDSFDYTPAEFARGGFEILARADETASEPEIAQPAPFRSVHGVELRPYVSWMRQGAPDPRSMDYEKLGRWIVDVVETEAPVTADRVYSLVTRSSGSSKVTHLVRSELNKALFPLRDRIDIAEFVSPETNWPQRVLSLPAAASVLIRERDDRDLETLPLNEVAAVFEELRARLPLAADESLIRYALDVYDLHNRTDRRDAYMRAALALLD